MASKSTRSRQHRRDRRKAKASGWARAGKTNMGQRIGHGNASAGSGKGKTPTTPRWERHAIAPPRPEVPRKHGATHRPFEAALRDIYVTRP